MNKQKNLPISFYQQKDRLIRLGGLLPHGRSRDDSQGNILFIKKIL